VKDLFKDDKKLWTK